MHEMSLTESIVAICAERAAEQGASARVLQVTIEVGRLAAVLPDALRFCFEVCARDTPLAGAELEIIDVPGLARCFDCGAELVVTQPFGTCGCGSSKLIVISGEELRIKQMEVEECA